MTSLPHRRRYFLRLDSLSDRARLLASDLLRTVQEYRALMANYRQSVTLTNTYSGGLKQEAEG